MCHQEFNMPCLQKDGRILAVLRLVGSGNVLIVPAPLRPSVARIISLRAITRSARPPWDRGGWREGPEDTPPRRPPRPVPRPPSLSETAPDLSTRGSQLIPEGHGLPNPGKVRTAVFDGQFFDATNGKEAPGGPAPCGPGLHGTVPPECVTYRPQKV